MGTGKLSGVLSFLVLVPIQIYRISFESVSTTEINLKRI